MSLTDLQWGKRQSCMRKVPKPVKSRKPKSLEASMAPSTATAKMAAATFKNRAGAAVCATSWTAKSDEMTPDPNMAAAYATAATPMDVKLANVKTDFKVDDTPGPSPLSTKDGSFVWLS